MTEPTEAGAPPGAGGGARRRRPRALVAGWFSFTDGHATAGDLLTRDVACELLERAGFAFDVAVAPPFTGGVDWRSASPERYSHVVFVCGPFAARPHEVELLTRFARCRWVGLNLSLLGPPSERDLFDVLFERDSADRVRPDLAFLSAAAHVPVVGACLVEPYEGSEAVAANAALTALLAARPVAAVPIDTRLDENSTGLRTPEAVEAVIARMDAVVTTRLHGTVLALKNGVPPLVVDPMGDGSKILRQAAHLGWPVAFAAGEATPEALGRGLDFCLSQDGRVKARECSERATRWAGQLGDEIVAALEASLPASRARRAGAAPGARRTGRRRG